MWERNQRIFAVGLLICPLLVAYPLHYWAFHYAGGWYVTTDLEAQDRAFHLASMYILNMTMIIGLCWFAALVLLYLSQYKRHIIGWLLVPFGVIFLLSVFLAYVFVESYITFS